MGKQLEKICFYYISGKRNNCTTIVEKIIFTLKIKLNYMHCNW